MITDKRVKMVIKSKAFSDGGMIPPKHTGFGEDVSPEFRITDAPEGTVSFAIIMDDLDVPFRKSFRQYRTIRRHVVRRLFRHLGLFKTLNLPPANLAFCPTDLTKNPLAHRPPHSVRYCLNHWVIWNIPKTDVIPEGLPKGARICSPINACQGIAWGKKRYRGPKPPFFTKREHRYVFTLYALDSQLDISEKSDKKALLDAMGGHILAEARITGKYRNGRDQRTVRQDTEH